MMRKITVVLLMCVFTGDACVFAAEPAIGVLESAVVREAAQLARLEAEAVQASGTQATPRKGHPVLIGAAIGAGVLGVAACDRIPANQFARFDIHGGDR